MSLNVPGGCGTFVTAANKGCLVAKASNCHLTLVQRRKIELVFSRGQRQSVIAWVFDIAPITISREVQSSNLSGGG